MGKPEKYAKDDLDDYIRDGGNFNYADEYVAPEAIDEGGFGSEIDEIDNENEAADEYGDNYDPAENEVGDNDSDTSAAFDDQSKLYTDTGTGTDDYSITDPNDPAEEHEEQDSDDEDSEQSDEEDENENREDTEQSEEQEEQSDEQARQIAVSQKIIESKSKGQKGKFNLEFIKTHWKKLREHPKLKPQMDKINLKAGSAITTACAGFDYLLVLVKPKYLNPLHKLDAIIELVLIDEGIISSMLFSTLRDILNSIMNMPIIQTMGEVLVVTIQKMAKGTNTPGKQLPA